ncbi:MAG: hypothetical protein HQ553_16345 [Chloroflexi bacterium]|nr:hypothetical protein [Chloroflexota bacterium]
MRANAILKVFLTIFRTLLFPVWVINCAVVGVASRIPGWLRVYQGLLTLMWIPFLRHIVATSRMYQNVVVTRPLLIMVSIPVLVIADIFLTMLVDIDCSGKQDKAMIIDRWPFSSTEDVCQMPFNRSGLIFRYSVP